MERAVRGSQVLGDPVPRGRFIPGRPDGPPACPACGRVIALAQLDQRLPDQAMGACQNRACSEWQVWVKRQGRWVVAERLPASLRTLDRITDRPATAAAASR